ncbi:MAG: DMT family transporter [Bacteroidales bacterium]|nr:DMT family transporter [Bacteroidales bacterium]
MNKKTFSIYASAVIAMIFWSYSFIWYKEVFVYYKPITLVLFRLVISSVFLFILTLSLKRLNSLKLADVKNFLLLAFFEPFLYFIGESFGVSLIPSTLAAVIVATIPLFNPIGAYYFHNERISMMNFFGIVVSIIGVGIVIFHNGIGVIDANPLGVALMFVAVVAALGYSVIIKKMTTKYNVLSIITYQNTFGIIFFIPVFFIFEFNHFKTVTITWDVMIPLLKLGIFSSTFAFIFFTFSIKHLGITKSSIFTNTIPVVTAILAWIYLGEDLSFTKIIGIVVVIGGLFLSQFHPRTITTLFSRNNDDD